jgi:FlaA1/EpsC-like NDP-sugar epimerase
MDRGLGPELDPEGEPMTRNDGRANAGQDVILVTGATGHVGRQVVSQLLRAAPPSVR